jgi:hypothetical protein
LGRPAWWRRARQHFSIDAPRMTVRSRLPWPWRAALGIVLIAVVGGMWWWGFDFGQFFGGVNRREVEARMAALEAGNVELRKENARLKSRTLQQETELAMASGKEATLSRQALELSAENAQIKEEVAFLQQLVADSNKQAGLSIQRLTVDRESDSAWRYQVLVVRGGSPREEFKGNVAMQLTLQPAVQGSPAPRPMLLTLPDDQPGSAAVLRLQFKYYQRLEGTIAVPAGAAIRSVTVRAYEAGQTAPRATRSLVIP